MGVAESTRFLGFSQYLSLFFVMLFHIINHQISMFKQFSRSAYLNE